MARRHVRKVMLAVAVGALVGLVTTLCIPSGAQTGDSMSQDKTFCIVQHPSPTVAAATAAAGGVYADAGLPFVMPGSISQAGGISSPPRGSQVIWPGTPDGVRALVTVCLMGGSGSATVTWTEGEAHLDPGDSVTVLSGHVQIGDASYDHPSPSELDELEVEYGPGEINQGDPDVTGDEYAPGYYLVDAVYGTYTITVNLCD